MAKERITIEQHTFTGTLWAINWLCTIGFLPLTFWKGIPAIVIWPYLPGVHFVG